MVKTLKHFGFWALMTLVFALLYMLYDIPGMSAYVLFDEAGVTPTGLQISFLFIVSALIAGGAFYLAKRLGILEFDWRFYLNKKTLIGLMVAFVAMYVANIVTGMFMPVESENQSLIEDMANYFPVLPFVLTIAIVGPIFEEIIFRGLIIGKIFEKWPVVGLIVSSLIFGLMHEWQNMLVMLPYAVLGLIMGLVYLKFDKKLEASIFVHILNNAISAILIYTMY
jgi:membrane protease YdiL (CAAX protease family)